MGLFLDSRFSAVDLYVYAMPIRHSLIIVTLELTFFFFKIALVILGLLHFHMDFRISQSIYAKRQLAFLWGYTELKDQCGRLIPVFYSQISLPTNAKCYFPLNQKVISVLNSLSSLHKNRKHLWGLGGSISQASDSLFWLRS